jgi:hypothetical protein
MGPLPEDLKKKIMSFHPGLTEAEFSRYERLEEGAMAIDPLRYPDRKKSAEKELDTFVKAHMPRLEEAFSSYSDEIKAEYDKLVNSELPDPVDIAKTSLAVRGWLAGRQSTSKSILIKEPHEYLVEFKCNDGAEMHVKVDRYDRTVSVIFQRTIGQK